MTCSVRPQHRRIAALALAALWAAASFAALLHDDDHGHRYCVEHQAFEEGAAPRSTGSEWAASGSEDGVSAATAPVELSHQECPVANAPTREALIAPAVTSSVLFGSGEPVAPVGMDAAHAPISALVLAPKASPPVLHS